MKAKGEAMLQMAAGNESPAADDLVALVNLLILLTQGVVTILNC